MEQKKTKKKTLNKVIKLGILRTTSANLLPTFNTDIFFLRIFISLLLLCCLRLYISPMSIEENVIGVTQVVTA